ncbi:MAG: hypothetical protein HRT68_12725 [Flavobacteriaceae bacterium]|nr:hypothetical protein [Flavobacteriaceae bacterium]
MNKNRIIAMSFAILSVITLLYCTQEYHLGFSPDSISYRDAAQKIIEGDVITDRYGNIINRWPPIYSISIAGVSTLFNCGVLEGATYLNCILIFILFLLFNKSIIRFGISVSLQLILNLKLLFSYLFFQYLMYFFLKYPNESLYLQNRNYIITKRNYVVIEP